MARPHLPFISYQDPKRSRSYRLFIELCRRANKAFPDRAVNAMIPGPWSNAMNFRGAEAIIFDTVEDPDFVHELMRITTDLAKARGMALAETGLLMVVVADPSASCSLISPKIYRRFVKPYHLELIDHFKENMCQSVFFGLHICGNIDPIMEDLVEVGPDFIEIDGPSSLKKMVEASEKRIVIRGNLPMELFLNGSREEIEQSVKACIETAAEGSAYILSHGCTIPPDAPLERIRYYMEAAFRYGTY